MASKPTASRSINFSSLLMDRKYFVPLAIMLWCTELVLNYVIIKKVPYTEIDWIAYMEEVKGVIDGEFDYANLCGQTGPLVYPAGFVYIYTALYYLTDAGSNILKAQYIFMAIYMVFIAVVYYIYYKSEVIPPWVLLLVSASRRIHSIFVLRLFNDCIAMLFLYIAIALFLNNKWSIGCFVYSLAVSVKMNILLFAPALLLLLLKRFGVLGTIPKLAICAILQLVLGLPFLMRFPWSYIKGSFDLGRKFFFVWTVNWKFVPEDIFLSNGFAIGLLLTQLVLLASFVAKWCRQEGGLVEAITKQKFNLSSEHIVTLLFTSNFLGIVCSRSLHFQFYVWYYHTIPYLLWRTSFPVVVRLVLLGVIEVCWNIFPSNPYTSATLLLAHLVLLVGLWVTPLDKKNTPKVQDKKDK